MQQNENWEKERLKNKHVTNNKITFQHPVSWNCVSQTGGSMGVDVGSTADRIFFFFNLKNKLLYA